MKNNAVCFLILIIILLGLAVLNLFVGSVHIPAKDVLSILLGQADPSTPWHYIVWESRLPQAITAILAGSGLAVSGLLLQTAFHNPLAGPSILGITAGANLGVALVMLLMGGILSTGYITIGGYTAVILAAFAGSILIISILLFLSQVLHNNLMLLITGILLSYLTSSLITLLNSVATPEGVQNYVVWGMGNFNSVTLAQLPFFCTTCFIGIVISLLLIKPLNALQLGEHYAENLGVNTKHLRNALLLATGLLTAVITAFCGPISFLGLAVPHVARLLTRSDNQRILMPSTLLLGGVLALLCNLICVFPENTIIPLNAVTPLMGAPVILYVIISKK